MELLKSELPYNTEVIFEGFNTQEMYIINETEKSFLMRVSKLVKKGTSKMSEYKTFDFWCPKTVWFNDGNFRYENDLAYFKCPYYLIKN